MRPSISRLVKILGSFRKENQRWEQHCQEEEVISIQYDSGQVPLCGCVLAYICMIHLYRFIDTNLQKKGQERCGGHFSARNAASASLGRLPFTFCSPWFSGYFGLINLLRFRKCYEEQS